MQLKPYYLLIQVKKPKYWIADIILCTIWVGWIHSPAGGIHVCGRYSSVLSPLLHSLLNVSIVTDRYNFQSISCNIQINREMQKPPNYLSFSLSLSEWITLAVFLFCWHYFSIFIAFQFIWTKSVNNSFYINFYYLFTIKSQLGMLSDLQTTFLSWTIQKVTNLFIIDFQHAECNLSPKDRAN